MSDIYATARRIASERGITFRKALSELGARGAQVRQARRRRIYGNVQSLERQKLF